jgi:hypothetical protein
VKFSMSCNPQLLAVATAALHESPVGIDTWQMNRQSNDVTEVVEGAKRQMSRSTATVQ